MKRILFLTLLLVSLATSAFAISLSELQNSPQFLKIKETSEGTYYLNQNSIKILRYAPPYYTLEYTEYGVSYSNKVIAELNTVANYNFNRSLDSLLDELIQNDRIPYNATLTDINRLLINEKIKNNGIMITTNGVGLYNFSGTLLFTPSPRLPEEVAPPLTSPSYYAAQSAFKKVYDIKF